MTNKTKILITGGYGFVGSHLIKKLDKYKKNLELICYDKLTYAASLKNLNSKKLVNKYRFYKQDICNFEKLYSVAKNCDYLINCAAESHVDKSFKSSITFLKTNIIGSRNIFECGRLSKKIKKIIQISTDEVYGENFGKPYKENSRLKPTNPYSASKASAEIVGRTFAQTFKVPLTIIRGNNLYGTNQYPEKIIPYVCYSLAKKKKIYLHGGGNVMRKFLHVEDFCDAIIKVLFDRKLIEEYNVGTKNKSIRISNLVKKICFLLEKDYTKNIYTEYDRPFNDFRYSIDSTKIRSLGWYEKKLFNPELKKICAHYYDKFSKL